MRLSVSKSKNSTSLYVIKSTYKNGVRSSKVVEKLGTVNELSKKLNGQDPIEWAKKYVEELNKKKRKKNERSSSSIPLLRSLQRMISVLLTVDIFFFNRCTIN